MLVNEAIIDVGMGMAKCHPYREFEGMQPSSKQQEPK
jgi:hypothetical protein